MRLKILTLALFISFGIANALHAQEVVKPGAVYLNTGSEHSVRTLELPEEFSNAMAEKYAADMTAFMRHQNSATEAAINQAESTIATYLLHYHAFKRAGEEGRRAFIEQDEQARQALAEIIGIADILHLRRAYGLFPKL
ncbi:MAG: hypothetical protein JJT94_05005 [Bernardetiaceae bacterium]|nr:hypothetical protein [Bernardetiaceae bacterium]